MPPIRPTLHPAELIACPVWRRCCPEVPRGYGAAVLMRATWRAILWG